MPGDGVEDGPHDLFELNIAHIGVPSDFNLKNYNAQQLDSLRGQAGESLRVPLNNTQLSQVTEFSRNRYVNDQVNRNVFRLAMQNQPGLLYESSGYNNQTNLISAGPSVLKFQQENDSGGSPTVTTNSERSEITEASTDFCFSKRQQENLSVLQKGFPQFSPMQQSGYDEMQLLRQQVMFKQLQDLQRQQQLQQQNYLDPFSMIHKQTNNSQFSPMGDGMPLNDASQGYINWVQRGASTAQQRTPSRAMFSVGLSPQQFDVSLYGAPVASARGNMSQHPMMYQESVNLLTKPGGQIQDQVSVAQGGSMSNQGFQGKNMSATGPIHGLSNGVISGNIQQINASLNDFNWRQERISWSEIQQKATPPSQGPVPLDPLEEKILFNMEEKNFSDIGSGGFGNTFDKTDFSNAFPSIQSGSWSALMQSAVAEASSSDTGVQEEWSGLTFQNTEPSADNNQVSNFIDNDKQQTSWVNNSLPSCAFPSFEQQKEVLQQDGSTPESVQRSLKVSGHWVDRTPQKKPSMEGNQQAQSHVHLDDSCASKMYLYSTGMIDHVQSSRDDSHVSNLASLSRSFQQTTSSHELPQRAQWNDVSGTPGKAGISSQFNVQASSVAPFPSGPLYRKNEPQMQMIASQSAEATFPGVTLEAELGRHSSVISSQQVEFPARPYNVWTDISTHQRPFNKEWLKVPLNTSSSVDVFGNSVPDLPKVQEISSEVYISPQRVGLPHGQEASAEHISDASTPVSDSSHGHFLLPKTDGTRPVDHGSTVSERNFSSASHTLKPVNHFPRNYSLIHHLQLPNNTETNPSKRDQKAETIQDIQQVAAMMGQNPYEHNSRLKTPVDTGMKSTSQLNPFAFGDTKMLNLVMEARKNQNVKDLLPNLLPDEPSSGMVGLGQCHSQTQSSSSNMVSSYERGQVNLHALAPTWLKQFGTFRNGQMPPIYDSKNIAGGQLSSGKPSHNLLAHAEQEDQAAQDANVRPDIMNQNMAIVRPKKRKLIVPEQLAWRKEVTQGSQKHQSISVAEQEWAQASNRLFEKVEDEVETFESIQTLPRSKRRLTLTAQLMQQLVCPAPAFILSADATLHYDCVFYFVARATLGDACSLVYSGKSSLPSSLYEANQISVKRETFERTSHQQFSEVVEGFVEKAKRLASDFQRLENAALIADVRLELQDLEKISVINRFARFHNSFSSALPQLIPQRYVTAIPLPRNLPEGVECLSL